MAIPLHDHIVMRVFLLVVSGLVAAASAWAQGGVGAEPQAGRGLRTDSPFRGGLVPGGLNTPRPGADVFRAPPGVYAPSPLVPWLTPSVSGPRWGGSNVRTAPRPGARQREQRGGRRAGGSAVLVPFPVGAGVYANGGIYLSPYYVWPTPTGQAGATSQPHQSDPVGFLRLMVTPRTASVIVDGIYEGLVDDFGGSGERPLTAGVRHVRLEAEGYESVEFDVRVPANDTIILRRDLYAGGPTAAQPLPAPPGAPVVPATKPVAPAPSADKVLYVIPRCYLGNTPPNQDLLPAGCRVTDVRTVPQ